MRKIDNTQIGTKLEDRRPKSEDRSPNSVFGFRSSVLGFRFSVFGLVLLCLSLLTGCARNPVTGKREIRFISDATERKLGADTKKQIIQQYGEYKNDKLLAYVNEIGQNLVSVSDRKNIPYEFTVLDTPVINAFAAPGGYIFVTRGILNLLEDEAQLATVVGHEVGHVAAWHGINMLEKRFGYAFLFDLAQVVVEASTGEDVRILRQATDFFSELFLLGYGRENELESDRMGVKYALATGYDPNAMIGFFEILAAKEGGDAHGLEVFFRSHPPTKDRVEQAKKYIAQAMPQKPDTLKLNRDRYKNMIQGLPAGEAPEKGNVEKRRYANDVYKVNLEVPEGWTLNNSDTQRTDFSKQLVLLFGPERRAQGELHLELLERDMSLAEFVGAMEKSFDFKKIKSEEHSDRIVAEYSYVQNSNSLRYRLIYRMRKRDGFVLSFVVTEQDFERFTGDFTKIQDSLKLE